LYRCRYPTPYMPATLSLAHVVAELFGDHYTQPRFQNALKQYKN